MNICKIYENEHDNGYELNTIDGVIKAAKVFFKKAIANDKDLVSFDSLAKDYVIFREENSEEIKSFKNYRDKFVAHAEHLADQDSLPSFQIMESLYMFAYQFYSSFSREYVAVEPIRSELQSKPKVALVHVLNKFGVNNVVKNLQ